MASEEFILARLSARSAGMKPEIPGGLAKYSYTDILNAASNISDQRVYYCIKAKWLDDDWHQNEVLEFSLDHSWRDWRRIRRHSKIDVETHDRIVELSFLNWLFPNRKRSDEGHARFLHCAAKTYINNYCTHQKCIANWLTDLENIGREDIHGYLYE